MKHFLKKHWSNILFGIFILLLLFPKTRVPIQVGVNRLISFSPSVISKNERNHLEDYSWQLGNLEGGRENLQEAHGEVVVLNLWATWCPPCIAEMPSFQEVYDQYKDEVTFFFVSSEEIQTLNAFQERHQYDLPVYQPLSMGPEALQSRSLPTTFVLSRSGEIVVKKTGSADWNARSFRNQLEALIQEDL